MNILLAAISKLLTGMCKQCFYQVLKRNVCFVWDFGFFSLQTHLKCSGKNIIFVISIQETFEEYQPKQKILSNHFLGICGC